MGQKIKCAIIAHFFFTVSGASLTCFSLQLELTSFTKHNRESCLDTYSYSNDSTISIIISQKALL